MFDRSQICESNYFYACYFGDYALINRLERMGFRMSPIATLTTMDRINGYLEVVAKKAPDFYQSEKFKLVTHRTTDYRRLKVTQLVTSYTKANRV